MEDKTRHLACCFSCFLLQPASNGGGGGGGQNTKNTHQPHPPPPQIPGIKTFQRKTSVQSLARAHQQKAMINC